MDLASFLKRLEAGKIAFRLDRCRSDAVMVHVVLPGQRWEVEFMDDGSVEVEVFKSDGETHDALKLDELSEWED